MSARITEAREKLKLWFFRDMNDETRLKLFSLFGLPTDEIGETHGHQSIALRHVLAAALSTEPGEADGMDPFEYCANEAEENAELIEQMRSIYPGDPHGALGRDANKMRRLAKSIRQLRPAAPLPEESHHG